MIYLNILSESRVEIEQIAKALLEEKLITSVNIDWERDRFVMFEGKIVKRKVNLLSSITKALLFQKIDRYVKEKFPDHIPEIYSLPVVNIDWELAQSLIEQTEKV